jgi:hypothetical protein
VRLKIQSENLNGRDPFENLSEDTIKIDLKRMGREIVDCDLLEGDGH